MGLGQKILVFTAAIVVTLVAVTLAWTTFESNRLARTTIEEGLGETRELWETLQADRYQKLKLGVRVLASEPPFFALLETNHTATIVDALLDRGRGLGSPLLIYTDWDGYVVARSDRGAEGGDLSEEPVVAEALEGGEPETIWEQDGQFFHTVSVPVMSSEIIGTLVGGFRIDEQLANQIRKLTRSEVAFLVQHQDQRPRIAVSSLGPAQQEALARWLETSTLPADDHTFDLDLPGDASVGILAPLTALSGERVGSVLALRSMAAETAAFRRFRNSMVLASIIVMGLALVIGHLGVSRITDPVRRLVDLVESARDGSYTGAVAVGTNDEIGTLARAFNGLLADLREKEQVIGFLKESQTKERPSSPTATTAALASGDTVAAGATTLPSPAGAAVRLEMDSVFAGRYRITSVLGKGGMGVVYRAHDQQLDEDVALKLLRPEVIENDLTLLDRFKLELKLARRITHRNVLRTHDFAETGGVPYISMEYVEGVMLKDLVASRGALPPGVGLRFAKQICHGLEAAHAQGVVHRDIKPHNMMILPESGELKIMDFGIARVSEVRRGEGGLTSDGTVLGTPDYMPPEQAQGHPADFRSDIYALGVVFYEMFTGRLPFNAETAMAVILSHIRDPPPAPTAVNPALPAAIERIVLRCMEKRPEARYQSVSELREELDAVSSRAEAPAA